MHKNIQCKDIPTIPILLYLFLENSKQGACFIACDGERDIRNGFPARYNTPTNLVRAKMQKLIDAGYVSGCACGCRGDFEITQRGIEFVLERHKEPK